MCNNYEIISRLAKEGVPLPVVEKAFAGCLSKRTVREYYRRARGASNTTGATGTAGATSPSGAASPLLNNQWIKVLRERHA